MNDEPPPMGVPEWVVTFGDMMSLLLTFFIMLVSMSEIKNEEKYQALVESMRRRFGHDLSMESVTPGEVKPEMEAKRVLSTEGRAKKLDTHSGGVPDKAPQGEEPKVRVIRPGKRTATGSVVFFEPGGAELSDSARAALNQLAPELLGKAEKVEIRGHSDSETARRATGNGELMDLAYMRARAVCEYLITKNQLPPHQLRISTAGDSEPMYTGTNVQELEKNARVEVFLLDETIGELQGDPTGKPQAGAGTAP